MRPGARVLVVDDNQTNRKILHHQMAAWGIHDYPVADGAQALETLKRPSHRVDPFDLVILDPDARDGWHHARDRDQAEPAARICR